MSQPRNLERDTLDGRDLVAAVHLRSLRELERLARAERARVLGNLIAALLRGLRSGAVSIIRESRLQLAAEALIYRTRRSNSR